MFSSLLLAQENLSKKSDSSDSVSQPKSEYDAFFVLGIKDEVIITENQSSGPSLYNIHLLLGFSFLKYYKIDMKMGFMAIKRNFTGMDEGIFFKADIFKTNIYIVTGIDIFSMIGQLPHGLDSGVFFYYGFGIEYNVSRKFSLDAMYYIPGSREIVYHDLFNSGAEETTINHNLISIGFQISFLFN